MTDNSRQNNNLLTEDNLSKYFTSTLVHCLHNIGEP